MLYWVVNDKAGEYLLPKKFREKLFFINTWCVECQKIKFHKNSTSDLVIKWNSKFNCVFLSFYICVHSESTHVVPNISRKTFLKIVLISGIEIFTQKGSLIVSTKCFLC